MGRLGSEAMELGRKLLRSLRVGAGEGGESGRSLCISEDSAVPQSGNPGFP